jgi:AraC-like DNA-binding protein
MSVRLVFAADRYPAGTHHAPHQHDTLQLSVVLSGHVVETVGGVTERASALSVVCKAPGVVHTDTFGDHGARLARLTLPVGDLAHMLDDARRATPWRWTHDPVVAAPFLRLVERAQGVRRARESRATSGATHFSLDDPDVLELLAGFTARARPAERGRPPAWLSDVITQLTDEWRPGLRVADVAHRAGVHPVYLARCVRRWFGVGVGELMRRLRLRYAISRCMDTDAPISGAARAAGFADEAHFGRAMRDATGVPPGRYRTMVHALACTPRPSH